MRTSCGGVAKWSNASGCTPPLNTLNQFILLAFLRVALFFQHLDRLDLHVRAILHQFSVILGLGGLHDLGYDHTHEIMPGYAGNLSHR